MIHINCYIPFTNLAKIIGIHLKRISKFSLQISKNVNSYLLHLCTNNNFFKKLLKKTIAYYSSIANYLTLENYRYIFINISKAHAKGCLV
jgi:hypothetical protein